MEGLDLSTKKIISILLLQQQILLLNLIKRRQYQIKKKRKKRYWMRKIFQEREEKSLFTTLVKDLQLFGREYFFKNFRMDTRTFEDLLSWIAPIIQKSSLRYPCGETLCYFTIFSDWRLSNNNWYKLQDKSNNDGQNNLRDLSDIMESSQ